jgi:hypothetical protein
MLERKHGGASIQAEGICIHYAKMEVCHASKIVFSRFPSS